MKSVIMLCRAGVADTIFDTGRILIIWDSDPRRRVFSIAVDIKRKISSIEIAPDQDCRPIERSEHLADHEFAGETAMLNLRTHEDRPVKFQAQTGYDPFEFFAEPIRKFVDLGLLEIQEDRIFLSLRGLTLSNEVLAEFL